VLVAVNERFLPSDYSDVDQYDRSLRAPISVWKYPWQELNLSKTLVVLRDNPLRARTSLTFLIYDTRADQGPRPKRQQGFI